MLSNITSVNVILFVENQIVSTQFYKDLFRISPVLVVDGMTEFIIFENLKIGLMPTKNIKRILPEKKTNSNFIKSELYFYVTDIQFEYENAIKAGAKLLSLIEKRNWGDLACYFADADNNVIAFAKKITQ